jgi:hypothetical protein
MSPVGFRGAEGFLYAIMDISKREAIAPRE